MQKIGIKTIMPNHVDVLKQMVSLERDAEDFGFAWEKIDQIFEKIQSEISEIKEHIIDGSIKDKAGLQEEIGDLFHAVISLCLFYQFDPEQTIANSVAKFSQRMDKLKHLTNEAGLQDLRGLSFDKLMDFWELAKENK